MTLDNLEKSFMMGSYKIDISKTLAALVEQHKDDDGIIWPLILAPYDVIITIVNIKNEEQMNLGEKIYNDLRLLGLEVLLDDRNERAGVKFKDRDLIGIPIRITVGKMAGEYFVEYSIRGKEDKIEVNIDELSTLIKAEFDKDGLKIK